MAYIAWIRMEHMEHMELKLLVSAGLISFDFHSFTMLHIRSGREEIRSAAPFNGSIFSTGRPAAAAMQCSILPGGTLQGWQKQLAQRKPKDATRYQSCCLA